MQIKEIGNAELGITYTDSWYRKKSKSIRKPDPKYVNKRETIEQRHQAALIKAQNKFDANLEARETEDDVPIISDATSEVRELLDQTRKERLKLSDERQQVTAMYRRISREETLREMAIEAAREVNRRFLLESSEPIRSNADHAGLLLISDWHYGISINNIFNTYNPEIARERIMNLRDQVIIKGRQNNITDLVVANLGDLIAGNIHLQIRINSRLDVISQTQEISEILAEFLADLSQYFNVTLYTVLDNHSRIDPNKETSLQLESLARFTPWYLKERLKHTNVKILDNTIDDNIATFKILKYSILGVHGDLDKQSKLVEKLTTFTQQHYDLIVSAHMHHFSADESNGTIVICNGSLMATDDYAFKLRLNSDPSQTLIILSEDTPVECIYRLVCK